MPTGVVEFMLELLLSPLLGGVANPLGSRYDKSSIGSTPESGSSCKI